MKFLISFHAEKLPITYLMALGFVRQIKFNDIGVFRIFMMKAFGAFSIMKPTMQFP